MNNQTTQTREALESLAKDESRPFHERGRAVAEIIQRGLFASSHSSLEAYSKEALGFSAERCRQLAAAADLYNKLAADPTARQLLPANEAQIRPLAALPVDRRVEVWRYIVQNAPEENITQAYVQNVCGYVAVAPNAPIRFLTSADVPEAAWPSDNDLDIPLLSLRMQADYCDLPFEGWGGRSRQTLAATWHFYTDDARFTSLVDDPTPVINSRCINAVEPNFSVYGQTPRVVGLHRIYQKRWIARFWQSHGVRIFVDMNVHPDFYTDNLFGVPDGWRAYATRGYTDRIADTIREFELACQRARTNHILFVVYGGGKQVKATAQDYGWIWFPEQVDKARDREISIV